MRSRATWRRRLRQGGESDRGERLGLAASGKAQVWACRLGSVRRGSSRDLCRTSTQVVVGRPEVAPPELRPKMPPAPAAAKLIRDVPTPDPARTGLGPQSRPRGKK